VLRVGSKKNRSKNLAGEFLVLLEAWRPTKNKMAGQTNAERPPPPLRGNFDVPVWRDAGGLATRPEANNG